LLASPVTVATGEKIFSKFKVIATFLSLTIIQDLPCGPAVFSVENEVSCQLDYNEIIRNLSGVKSSKIKFF